jgi:hypothetical protein
VANSLVNTMKSILAASFLLLVLVVSAGAQTSCQPLSLSASPSTVSPGEIETILVSIKSCSATPTFEHVVVSVTSDSCPANEAFSFNMAVGPRQNRTLSFSFPAPQCAGTYTVSATANGMTTNATFTVE